MPSQQQKHTKKRKPSRLKSNQKQPASTQDIETRASEALTVCWGVTITTLVMCNLVTIVAHYYVSRNPDAERMAVLGELLLVGGAVVGVISLVLLPILYRIRREPLPNGIAVFGACLALAPILGIIVKTMH